MPHVAALLWHMETIPRQAPLKQTTEGFHLLTTSQAAAALGIGKRTLQERVAAREIASVKIGKAVRFDPGDLKAYVESCKLKAIGWKGGSK